MLLATYNLLDKIQLGIKHGCDIVVSYNKIGLVIRVEYKDCKSKKYYGIEKIFSYKELLNVVDENTLVDYFIEEVNEKIRSNYLL